MFTRAIRRTTLFAALAALPGLAAAAGPINDAIVDYGTAYYGATTAYQRSLYYCDQKSPDLQDACRDSADARHGYPASGYRNELTEQQPAYVAHYDPSTVEYHFNWRYPGDTSSRNTNTNPRCAALTGAARVDCLHGAAPGGG